MPVFSTRWRSVLQQVIEQTVEGVPGLLAQRCIRPGGSVTAGQVQGCRRLCAALLQACVLLVQPRPVHFAEEP
ncbi:hypothetical protein D3C81_2130110 [compost metagenome]